MEIELKTVKDVEELLIKLIQRGNLEDPDFVPRPTTVPLTDIRGFDSLSALEVLTELEDETGLHFENGIFYVDVVPKKYLAIHDVALTIWKQIAKGG